MKIREFIFKLFLDKNGKPSGKRFIGFIIAMTGAFIGVWSAILKHPENYVLMWPFFVFAGSCYGVSVMEKKEI